MPSAAYVIEVNGVEVWRVFDEQQASRLAGVFAGSSVRKHSLATPSDKEGGE